MGILGIEMGEGVGLYLLVTNLFLTFGGYNVGDNFGENLSRNATESAHRRTD